MESYCGKSLVFGIDLGLAIAGELAIIARGPGTEQSVAVVTADDGPRYAAGQVRHVFPGAIR